VQCIRYLPRNHVFNFLHTRINFRFITRVPGLGVAVLGADGAAPPAVSSMEAGKYTISTRPAGTSRGTSIVSLWLAGISTVCVIAMRQG
jgi:hypothetical protein